MLCINLYLLADCWFCVCWRDGGMQRSHGGASFGHAISRSSRNSFVQHAMATYHDLPVHIKALPVKVIRLERKDLVELKWVNIFIYHLFYLMWHSLLIALNACNSPDSDRRYLKTHYFQHLPDLTSPSTSKRTTSSKPSRPHLP